jgi:hypothetical protein
MASIATHLSRWFNGRALRRPLFPTWTGGPAPRLTQGCQPTRVWGNVKTC